MSVLDLNNDGIIDELDVKIAKLNEKLESIRKSNEVRDIRKSKLATIHNLEREIKKESGVVGTVFGIELTKNKD